MSEPLWIGISHMAYMENVPVDISRVQMKVLMNLTKRQLICFAAAGLTGVPVYFVTKQYISTDLSALLMVGIMMPFFFLAMYERDGFPAEMLLYHQIRQSLLVPGLRLYQSENLYHRIERQEKLRKEVERLERKAGIRQYSRSGNYRHEK